MLRELLGLTLAMAATGGAMAAELYLVGGKVFTGDADGSMAQAVAIRDGRIIAVGDNDAIRALAAGKPAETIVDLGGRLVVPGLVEAHGHAAPSLAGRRLDMPNLPWPGPTPEEALAAVQAAAKQGPGWIDGEIGPLVVNDMRDWRLALDTAAPDNPVMLRPWWGHGMLLNSAALKALGKTDAVADPPGGWYGRRADGTLDGRVREAPEWALMRQRAAAIPLETSAQAYRDAAKLYAGWGVTTYHHMMHNQPLADGLKALEIATPPIKWSVYGWAAPEKQIGEAWSMFAAAPRPGGHVRIAGVKWVLDSTPIERDAHMRQPYADRPEWRGRPNYDATQLDAILRGVLANPQQPAFHVSGDAQLSAFIAAMEKIAPASAWRIRRIRIEHGDGLTPDLITRAKALGLVFVTNPLHLDPMPDAQGVPMMVARLGDRAKAFQPMKTLAEAGLPLAIGSDAGGPAANPYLNIMLAVIGPSNPSQALTREQALAAYARGGAYAEGQEAVKGMLKAGMAADLAVLSQDILTAPLDALPRTRSLLTLVDGKPIHAEGQFAPLMNDPS